MFCERCGSPNPEGSTFCASCGARMTALREASAVRQAPVAQAPVPDDPYDVERTLYDPSYDDYDDAPYDPTYDAPWEPAPEDPYGQPSGASRLQAPDPGYGPLPDQHPEQTFAGYGEPLDRSEIPQDPSVYGSPYREDDPYLAQYLSQQQYRAEHGYMTPGSPGPRGKGPIPEEADGPLKERRSLALYIILSIVTLGIYGWYATHCMARDANTLCAADGERTTGVGLYVLFSLLTFGIYSIYWIYKLAERLYQNAPAYGLHFEQNGLVILLWYTVGALILVGPFIAMHYVFRDLDELSRVYNERYVFNWR